MNFSILETIVTVLVCALFVTAVFRYLHLPSILGYLVVGTLIGPHGLGFLPDVHVIKDLAEFGIVFLMFTVGLEFSLKELFKLKFLVFVLGALQVVLTVIAVSILGTFFGLTWLQSFVIGGVVAMSSTAIVTKFLKENGELTSNVGRNAIGILLFQDLAVVPFLILIGSLGAAQNGALVAILSMGFVKGVIATVLILLVGRWVMRPLFHVVKGTNSIELFTLMVLLVTLAAAWFSDKLGLSYALGAFLAGIMLGETEYRRQIDAEIRPFRDVLLGLFFISVGMLLDLTNWPQTWVWISLLLTAIVLAKFLVVFLLTRLTGNGIRDAMRVGLILAQGSEFGFAILALALTKNLLPLDYGEVVLSALVVSIALAPLLIHFNRDIVGLISEEPAQIKS